MLIGQLSAEGNHYAKNQQNTESMREDINAFAEW